MQILGQCRIVESNIYADISLFVLKCRLMFCQNMIQGCRTKSIDKTVETKFTV